MADHFLLGLQNLKQSFSLSDIDPNFEFLNLFSGQIPGHQESSGLNFHSLIGCPHDNLFPQLSEPTGKSESFPGFFINDDSSVVPPVTDDIISNGEEHRDKKRKALNTNTPESSSANSSPQGSENGKMRKNSSRRGKKLKSNEKEDEKLREVVHVRAKRGQATDSHSLAERVRRGKINERLRCLQDIVPGCYKTMGMAVMLDEIINYVQSLQNQVEFLSMKLTAASSFYDFNSDIDAMETMQKAEAFEAFKLQSITSQRLPSAQFGPLDLNFDNIPQLPHNS